jgi:16S rRNA processing protein RimM
VARKSPQPEIVIMGRIIAALGIKGWVKVKAFTASADGLAAYPVWWLEDRDGWTPFQVEDTALHAKGFGALFKGVADRSTAESLRGRNIGLPRDALPQLDADEIYWVDLIGLAVRNPKGDTLGKIDNLMETGANDVLVVKAEDGKQRLIPFIPQVVLSVDRDAGEVTVDWEADY